MTDNQQQPTPSAGQQEGCNLDEIEQTNRHIIQFGVNEPGIPSGYVGTFFTQDIPALVSELRSARGRIAELENALGIAGEHIVELMQSLSPINVRTRLLLMAIAADISEAMKAVKEE